MFGNKKILERIEAHLAHLVDLAEASGIASSVVNTETRENRVADLEAENRAPEGRSP